MKLHREGIPTIILALTLFIGLNSLSYHFLGKSTAFYAILGLTALPALFAVCFFRTPRRHAVKHADAVIAPADGTIVAIEEVEEPEVLKCRCLQVSIFMSIFSVHINWFPVSGLVTYFKHHNGNFKAAYLPKSSTENERTSILIERKDGGKVLVRQVAGALARRIVSYAAPGKEAKQSEQMGFIKFGSRVDMYLPLGTQIDVKLKDKTAGSQTIIGWLKPDKKA